MLKPIRTGVFLLMSLSLIHLNIDQTAPLTSINAANATISREISVEFNPYERYSIYKAEKLSDYQMFQQKFPDLETWDVLWRVNAGLHAEFYENTSEIKSKTPLLVNPYNQLPEDFIPPELEPLADGKLLTAGAKFAFEKMCADAETQGVAVDAASAYRSFAEERAQKPGFSEHQTGRAIDLIGTDESLENFSSTPEFAWIAENCAAYGFILRYPAGVEEITGYPDEPGHITFVGKEIALDMQRKEIHTLEEYVAKKPETMDL
ncbi:MAG: M15 family metallopeptidase, partial [Clostridiales bacterium]|nr:M15 family metallopeptidase [Clostridiales bacterium]